MFHNWTLWKRERERSGGRKKRILWSIRVRWNKNRREKSLTPSSRYELNELSFSLSLCCVYFIIVCFYALCGVMLRLLCCLWSPLALPFVSSHPKNSTLSSISSLSSPLSFSLFHASATHSLYYNSYKKKNHYFSLLRLWELPFAFFMFPCFSFAYFCVTFKYLFALLHEIVFKYPLFCRCVGSSEEFVCRQSEIATTTCWRWIWCDFPFGIPMLLLFDFDDDSGCESKKEDFTANQRRAT